jgi:hypothetical protein
MNSDSLASASQDYYLKQAFSQTIAIASEDNSAGTIGGAVPTIYYFL